MASRSSAKKRRYRSALREEQAGETRARILEALIQSLAEDPDQVSIARVATLAGVSEPTVFRHFPNKRAMYAAVRADVERRLNVDAPPPATEEEFFPLLRDFFTRYENLGPARLALASSPQAATDRLARAPTRLAWVGKHFAAPLSRLREPERSLMRDVLAALASSGTMLTFRNYLGISAADAATRVEWAIRTLVTATERGRPKHPARRKQR